MNNEYMKAFSEVNLILGLLPQNMKIKIPASFLEFVNKNKSDNYNFNFDMNLPLSKQNLLKETKIILSLIYRNYLCMEDVKKKLEIDDIIEIKTNEIKLFKQHNYENIFKNKNIRLGKGIHFHIFFFFSTISIRIFSNS